jgi:hypothetical protein
MVSEPIRWRNAHAFALGTRCSPYHSIEPELEPKYILQNPNRPVL